MATLRSRSCGPGRRSEKALRNDYLPKMITPPPVEDESSTPEEARPALVVDAASSPPLHPVESTGTEG